MKATWILEAVLNQVRVCPSKYYDFMTLPSLNDPCFRSLHEEITVVYESLKELRANKKETLDATTVNPRAIRPPNYAYSMLIALPVNPCTLDGFVWAFFSITVDSPKHTKMFQNYLDKHFKDHPFHPIERYPIESLDEVVELTIPDGRVLKPYTIVPSIKPPRIKKKDVLNTTSNDDEYPPRIRLNITLTEQPRIPLSCDIRLSGIKGVDSFTLRVVPRREMLEHNARDAPRDKRREISLAKDVEIDDIECDSSHHATLYQQLSEHAAKWREIGTHLGFRQGELDFIASKPCHYHGGSKSCLSAMLSEWLEWAPGDGRGSVRHATLNQLKVAVAKSGLGRTAHNLEL